MVGKEPSMPAVRVENESHEHAQRRKNITELEWKVDKMMKLEYSEADLNKIHIRTFTMDLGENNRPTFQPCFFMPYQGDLNIEPYDEEVEEVGWKWQPRDGEDSPLRGAEDASHYYYDYVLTQAYEVERSGSELPLVGLVSYVFSP